MDLSFYVYNNLRATQDHMKHNVYRFATLQEAIEKYNELPSEWTSALGGSIDLKSEVDFVHRRNGESVLVTDYRKMNSFNNREDVNLCISELINKLNIDYELLSGVHPHVSILSKLTDTDKTYPYFNDKILYIKHMDEKKLFDSINEVYVEGKGWLSAKQFEKLNTNQYFNDYNPKVSFVNVEYISKSGERGQADINPKEFVALKKKTRDFIKEHSNEYASLYTTMNEAVQKAKEINKTKKFEMIKEENLDK